MVLRQIIKGRSFQLVSSVVPALVGFTAVIMQFADRAMQPLPIFERNIPEYYDFIVGKKKNSKK